jgi:hypothetical protein
MTKDYLYFLIAIFILINVLPYFESEIYQSIKNQHLLEHKISKQDLYSSHTDEVRSILKEQESVVVKNAKFFFDKKQKQTIIYTDIQNFLQSTVKKSYGTIVKLDTGVVIDKEDYKKYLVSLNVKLIPEDLNLFFKNLLTSKYYLFIDSLYISRLPREQSLMLQLTLLGYQLK